jgi:hypothetical protein
MCIANYLAFVALLDNGEWWVNSCAIELEVKLLDPVTDQSRPELASLFLANKRMSSETNSSYCTSTVGREPFDIFYMYCTVGTPILLNQLQFLTSNI